MQTQFMPLYETYAAFQPILLSIQVAETTDENLREYLATQTELFESMHRRGRRCVSVVDCSVSAKITAVQRSIYAEWINETKPLLDACLAGSAFVMPSALVRGALTAIFWIARLSAPHSVHAHLDQGLEWSLDLARRERLPLHPALELEGSAAFWRVREASA